MFTKKPKVLKILKSKLLRRKIPLPTLLLKIENLKETITTINQTRPTNLVPTNAPIVKPLIKIDLLATMTTETNTTINMTTITTVRL